MSNAYGGMSPAQMQAMIRQQIQQANQQQQRQQGRNVGIAEDALKRFGGGGGFYHGRPELTLNQLGTDWRNIRSLEVGRQYWKRPSKLGSGLREEHRARGRELADGYADEEDQDGPYAWEGNGEGDVSEPDFQPTSASIPPTPTVTEEESLPWQVPESRSTYVGGKSTFDPTEMVGGSEPAPVGKPKRVMSAEQRERSNTRRRELTAQRREAVTRLSAQDEMDWSGSGVMVPNANPGPLWSGGPEA